MSALEAWRASAYAARRERLAARLHQPVIVQRWTGQDAYAKPTYAPAVTLMGQISGVAQLVRTAGGQEAASNTTILLPGNAAIGVKDRLTLPDGTHPTILSVNTVPDQAGNLTTQVYT